MDSAQKEARISQSNQQCTAASAGLNMVDMGVRGIDEATCNIAGRHCVVVDTEGFSGMRMSCSNHASEAFIN